MASKTFTFNSSGEGWRVFDDTTKSYTGSISYDSMNDRIFVQDTSTTNPRIASPEYMSGDQSALIGGTWEFDCLIDNPGVTASFIPVTLRGQDGLRSAPCTIFLLRVAIRPAQQRLN